MKIKDIITYFLLFIISVYGFTTANYSPNIILEERIIICSVFLTLIISLLQQFYQINFYNKELKAQRENYYATLTHDLKTPIIAQRRALELLINNQFGILNKEQKEILCLTLDSSRYLYHMVKSQLATYNIEDKITLHYSIFDLKEMIHECIQEDSDIIKQNTVTINYKHNSSCFIQADKKELKLAIKNFIYNGILLAAKSNNLTINLITENKNVILELETQKINMKQKEIERFFQKYPNSFDKYDKVGMGIGMYASKKIIEAHKGCIIITNKQQESHCFGFQIPIYTT